MLRRRQGVLLEVSIAAPCGVLHGRAVPADAQIVESIYAIQSTPRRDPAPDLCVENCRPFDPKD